MNFLQFTCLDLLWPKEGDKTSSQSVKFGLLSFKCISTHVQRCRRHLSRSSPAASFAFRTSSMRRPIAASESFKMATLSSRGMSSPDSFSCFCAMICKDLFVYIETKYDVSYQLLLDRPQFFLCSRFIH